MSMWFGTKQHIAKTWNKQTGCNTLGLNMLCVRKGKVLTNYYNHYSPNISRMKKKQHAAIFYQRS